MTEQSEAVASGPSEAAAPGATESVALPGLETAEPGGPAVTPPDAAAIAGPLEALLLMATEPVPTTELAQAVRAPVGVVDQALGELARFYDETGRGFELRNVGGGWRYWTRAEHADLIGAWLIEGQQARLSQAALETLAVVAYLQPISRGRVSAVRGVNVDGVLRTLVTRDLIHEVDRDGETGAMLFGTTAHFLERLGLSSLDDLPPIAPLLPDAATLEAELRESPATGVPRASDVTPPSAVTPPPAATPLSAVTPPSAVIPADAGISRLAEGLATPDDRSPVSTGATSGGVVSTGPTDASEEEITR